MLSIIMLSVTIRSLVMLCVDTLRIILSVVTQSK
jgi:hypothetical protein